MPCRPFLVPKILLIGNGVAPCLLPCLFAQFLFAPVEHPRTLVKEAAQAADDYRRREVAVELAVPARAEAVEEQQQLVGLEAVELRDDYLGRLGELVPVGLPFQPLEVAEFVKLRHKSRLGCRASVAGVQLRQRGRAAEVASVGVGAHLCLAVGAVGEHEVLDRRVYAFQPVTGFLLSQHTWR